MLISRNYLVSSIVLIAALALQLWLVINLQLFGDESFYWLESRFPSLSYSEIPGWNVWMIALSTQIFGNTYFGVRAFAFLGYFSIFFAITLIQRQLFKETKFVTSCLLILSVPLLTVVALLALPDIWMLVFVIWIIYLTIKAIQNQNKWTWVLLGVLLALAVNIHVRMWIWIFFAGIVYLYHFHDDKNTIKPLLLISFPIMLIGFIPVLAFNMENEFPLFVFQFSNRHPWSFQTENLYLIVSQVIVVSPIVLYLCVKTLRANTKAFSNQTVINWILSTALIHWLFYIITGLFADNVRTSFHWLLVSYIPVLIMSIGLIQNQRIVRWSIYSGLAFSILFLIVLILFKQPFSYWQSRFFDNSTGWKQLADEVSQIQKEYKTKNLITDYFMTGAELAFELNDSNNLKVLPHEKNIKHGRQKQLEVMGLLLNEPEKYNKHALLVIEDSAIKLSLKGGYYSELCDNFSQLHYIKGINNKQSGKLFHVFEVNNGADTCELPPLIYAHHEAAENNHLKIKGWVFFHRFGVKQLYLHTKKDMLISKYKQPITTIDMLYFQLQDPDSPFHGFEITVDKSEIRNNQYQIKVIGNDEREYFSAKYYLD